MKLPGMVIIICLALCTACNLDKEKKVAQDKLDFSTTDESELFFKNLRQSYYDLQDIPGAGMNVFRFKERSKEEDHPVINLAIVHQWKLDEASILVEPNAFFGGKPLSLNWQNDSTGGVLSFAPGNREVQQEFAVSLYDHLVAKDSMWVTVNQKIYPWPHNQKEREAYRITTFDYLRLVGAF